MSRVALIGENSTEYINSLLDIWNAGDCAVLIDWRIPFTTAIEMMYDAEVEKCFIEEKFIPKDLNLDSLGIEFVAYSRKNLSAELIPPYIYDKYIPNYSKDEAIVIYSSGTTGKAKGVILSHFAISTNADAIIDYMKPTDKDCIYFPKTFSHSSSITGEILVALKTKMRAVVAPIIVPPRYVLANLQKFKVTIVCVNPTLLNMYAAEYSKGRYVCECLRVIYVSGSILNDKIWSFAHEAFRNIPIYNMYGLSEAAPRVTAQSADCCKSNSVGKPIKGIEIAIVNEKGEQVPCNERGIIHVKTPSLFSGYIIGNKELKSLYKDWLNTGDIGYFDSNGELHVTERVDDVIIIDSHKIYPGEVERQILSHMNVKECSVVKVVHDDTELIGCLYVGDDVIENASNILKGCLLPYEIPRIFIRCEELPRNNNGKISRSCVQANLLKYINRE